MSFFSLKAVCSVCNQEVGLNRTRIADKHWVCPSCFKEAGLKALSLPKPVNQITVDDIHSYIAKQKENAVELESFVPTKKIGSAVEFDDNQKKWLILSEILGSRKKSTVYNYSDILDFELLEDGESISSGGLGRALVGGALFGGAGAIVGGVTGKKKTKGICESLKIKVTLKDINNPVVYVNFITSSTKKSSFLYKQYIKDAHECLSTLQLICDQQKEPKNTPIEQTSNADEIRKFKQLLDDGIISEDEFDAKKKELLRL